MFEFHRNRIGDDVIKFSANNCPYFKVYWTSNFILDIRSRSHVKVKGHRRGVVWILWMLLVFTHSRLSQNWRAMSHGWIKHSTNAIMLNSLIYFHHWTHYSTSIFLHQPFYCHSKYHWGQKCLRSLKPSWFLFLSLLLLFTPPQNRGGVIFLLQFVCVSVCVSVRLCLWTKFQPNGWTDLDVVFAKWLLTALTRTLLKLVTLGQSSRSQWRNTPFFFIILC